jgi:hypothetical protein
MGNKFTKSLSWVGELTYLGYQLINQLTYFTKRLLNRPHPRNIEKEAIVAGAIDWIVVSPS